MKIKKAVPPAPLNRLAAKRAELALLKLERETRAMQAKLGKKGAP